MGWAGCPDSLSLWQIYRFPYEYWSSPPLHSNTAGIIHGRDTLYMDLKVYRSVLYINLIECSPCLWLGHHPWRANDGPALHVTLCFLRKKGSMIRKYHNHTRRPTHDTPSRRNWIPFLSSKHKIFWIRACSAPYDIVSDMYLSRRT